MSKDGLVLFTININYQDTYQNFLKLEDVSKMVELDNNDKPKDEISFTTGLIIEEIFQKLKAVNGNFAITNEDILQFLENSYLVENDNIKSNCSNYKQLNAYIDRRKKNYLNQQISIEQIDQLSFKLTEITGKFVDEKSCIVCLNDYEKDQEVCQLPCNHFCCRNCTVKMFAIPNDGSKANFQCPYCRDDCT